MKFVFNPRVHTRLADTDTPISLYLKIRDHFAESILLESGDQSTDEHRYSYICCQPIATFSIINNEITECYPDASKAITPITPNIDVMQHLAKFKNKFSIETETELYKTEGLYGYIGYNAVRYFETITLQNHVDDEQKIKDMHFSFYGTVLVFDHFKNTCHIVDYNDKNVIPSSISYIQSLLGSKQTSNYPFSAIEEENQECSDNDFLELVKKAKEHCYNGDVFQIVLSRGFSTLYTGDDFNVYRTLRSINPSPYLFYFDYGNYRLLGSSPEAQLKIENEKATIHPIAGTFKRTGDPKNDEIQAQKLRLDTKENAEHTMLVDLARNDLSKNFSTVQVAVYKDIRMFSHVIHMVSEVTGTDPIGIRNSLKIVADTFPAGTLSGAPKYKAMQLIDRYENKARGFYGGCIGYMGFNGDFNQAIMIRTILSKNQKLFYQAGAGIVAHSVPELELKEIDNKLKALRISIQQAQKLHP